MTSFWREWVGSLDGIPTMWVRNLLARWGCKADLHKFVRADDPGCLHTHPAYAIRIVLGGGYVEELEDGTLVAWRAGDVGLIRPATCHRVAHLLGRGPAYTLWLRGPKIAKIELRGSGWPRNLRPVMGAVLAPAKDP